MQKVTLLLCVMVTIGTIFNGCKEAEELPTVEFTRPATSITPNSAQSGGYVISEGTAPVTERGIVYGTSENPTTSNTVLKSGTGRGTFSATITGLSVNTKYYVRAYAINDVGIAYAEQISFTTNPNPVAPTVTTDSIASVEPTMAVILSTVIDNGGSSIIRKGVVYGTSPIPTFADNFTNNGDGTGSFTTNLSGLTINTTYYVRAYAINAVDTSFGDVLNFMTSDIPEVNTNPLVDSISYTTAISGGEVINNGGAPVTARGVVYSTSQNPTLNDKKVVNGASGIGAFTSKLTGLMGGTTYYIRAYATNSAGTAYGNEVSFTTNPYILPTVTTNTVSSVSYTVATSGGNVIDNGGTVVTARGVAYNTSPNPTISNDTIINGNGLGNFTSNLKGLMAGTTYYVRAYATNSVGTAYGDEETFITNAVVIPTLTTLPPTQITASGVRTGGNILGTGGGAITVRGVAYSTSNMPTIADDTTVDGSGSGSYFSNIANLQSGTTYYARAYATNSAGTAYGNEVSFITISISLPTLTTLVPTSITGTSAVSGGNITANGGAPVTARGVVFSTNPAPTTANGTTFDGSGTGSYTSVITGLSGNTTYYVRAYATNNMGTAYGNQEIFTTDSLPVVITTAVTAITSTTAESGGTVVTDGGNAVTTRGVVYGLSPNPTMLNNVLVDGNGTGSFISSLSGLISGNTYYIRAYATSSAGTAYGNELNFTTP